MEALRLSPCPKFEALKHDMFWICLDTQSPNTPNMRSNWAPGSHWSARVVCWRRSLDLGRWKPMVVMVIIKTEEGTDSTFHSEGISFFVSNLERLVVQCLQKANRRKRGRRRRSDTKLHLKCWCQAVSKHIKTINSRSWVCFRLCLHLSWDHNSLGCPRSATPGWRTSRSLCGTVSFGD